MANLFFTGALHRLLSGEGKALMLLPLWECAAGVVRVKQQGLLFLSFESLLFLCCILLFMGNKRSYQSNLMKVTDEIRIPVPVGQFQHGSSRWMEEKEKDKHFATYRLSPTDGLIRELLSTGYEGPTFGEKTEDMGEVDKQEDRLLFGGTLPIEEETKEEKREQEEKEEQEGYEDVEYVLKARKGETERGEIMDNGKRQKTIRAPCLPLKEGGIVVGMTRCGKEEKIYYIPEDTHTLTIGATRSGKTRTLVLQSLCLMALAGESMVISDPKAELYQYTAPFLEKLGYEVICLDFKHPEKSSRYNLLQPIIDAVNAKEMDKAEMYAWDITNILVGDNTSNEKIWETGEKSTIAAAILCVVVDNAARPQYQNLTNVYWFVAEMCKAVGNKTPMQEYVKKLRAGHPARALLSISDVAPSRTRGSFYTSALTTLRLFTSRAVYSITHQSDQDIARMGRKKQALFFILPDEKTTYYPIASLMVSQLYELLVHQSDERGGRLLNRVNFVLEEFGNFTKINDLTNKLTVAGGRGIRFHFFVQSLEQLTEKYNKETAAIVKSNCQSWIYLQADDKETLAEICEKLGKYTCSGYQLSSQHGRYVNPSSSSTISLVARDLLTTDEIRRVSRPYQIVVSRSHPAMMMSPDLSQWYFNRMLGLGDKEHNRRVREERERRRPVLTKIEGEIPLWNIWIYYAKDLQRKEERQQRQQQAQGITLPAGSLFAEKFMKRGGKRTDSEEES